jgi:hypothetical protein
LRCKDQEQGHKAVPISRLPVLASYRLARLFPKVVRGEAVVLPGVALVAGGHEVDLAVDTTLGVGLEMVDDCTQMVEEWSTTATPVRMEVGKRPPVACLSHEAL